MAEKKTRRGMAELLAEQRAKLGESTVSAPEVTFQPPEPEPAATPPAPAALPEPVDADDTGPLTAFDRKNLATCEAAIDTLRTAFWAAGKALNVIRAARLYRETHDTFEDYLRERWEMSTSQAYRLIEAWPLAERLSPIGDTLNEAQVRELLPFANWRGSDAAETVYRTITEADGVKVTAAVIRGALRVLPEDREFDTDKAVEQIRAYLAGELKPAPAAPADPGEQVEKVRATIRRINVKRLRNIEPEARRELAEELHALADELAAE
jgi:hypothetical protein